MNPLLNADLFISICEYFYNIKSIIDFELISSYHRDLIRNNRWNHMVKGIKSDAMIEGMVKFHTFLKLDLSNTDVIDVRPLPYFES